MRDLFTNPPRLPLIAPSILSADFADMGGECRHILDAGADLLHLDVMDGHFVPNLTMGPDMCRALRAALPEAFLDVHLMVTDPLLHAGPFIDAGADHVTFHVEIGSPAVVRDIAATIRDLGVSVGLAMNPPTPVEEVLPLAGEVDLMLVMSVNPGYSGQSFIPDVLSKTTLLRERLGPDQRLQMDGGVSPSTAASVRAAGCDVLVAASAIFGTARSGRAEVLRTLRGDSPGSG